MDVAVVAVGVVEMLVDQIVGVISVRNRLVAAVLSMLMVCRVLAAFVRSVHAVHVTVVEIIDVPLVANGRVPAVRAMCVWMIRMSCVRHVFSTCSS